MLSIIYTYRNRDAGRVKRSLESLEKQNNKNFQVFFVDYGSDKAFSQQIQILCSKHEFVIYNYCYTQFQPWNKSRALNFIIKDLNTEYCFIADVDMIFHPSFVERAISLQDNDTTVYFQVGFLDKTEDLKNKTFFDFKRFTKSTFEATGLSMFPVQALKGLRGFDEFYHFWGAEDTDMHERLRNAGYDIQFYDNEILMLHQWHGSFTLKIKKKIKKNNIYRRILELNSEHLIFNRELNICIVNPINWGRTTTRAEFEKLLELPVSLKLDTECSKIDHISTHILPNFTKNFKIRILTKHTEKNCKYYLKKIANKKVKEYYTQEEINKIITLNLIASIRNEPYIYRLINKETMELAVLRNSTNFDCKN